ncbi:LacI family DNA-binding transcriptional regulator [Aminivibrio sp.]|jgi:LacI family transcriptional regulator|uniref:LacI family DNA-binding transcriptional regulator n=1 Tax=Aminivibrio sp. TaxID=1872489 RepID=UPI001A5A4F83|nr:LacI family DNA-binding transcriptional regulator [Aminivibrio sp.]MBL3538452.1 LacI family DNA-binding transcriptional regulator [Aminivibrio sp.]MDK2958373.1 LacI family transcriptional regulator [Synergistaceae bacterium]
MAKATMEDVARLAGVNKATVSRALRGDSRISQATREKVWKIAKNLGYRLDLAASSLSGGKTGIAALVLDEMDPWLTGPFLEGLNRVLSRTGMDLLLKLPGCNPGELFSSLEARHVDCILWAGREERCLEHKGTSSTTPMVTAGFSLPPKPAVLISPERTMERLKTLAGETGTLRYWNSGGVPLFPFLSRMIVPWKTGEKKITLVIDGEDQTPLPGERCVFCTRPGTHPPLGMYSIEWPAFEFGVTAARILVNVLHGQSPVPEVTYLVPTLKSPEGDTLPYVK